MGAERRAERSFDGGKDAGKCVEGGGMHDVMPSQSPQLQHCGYFHNRRLPGQLYGRLRQLPVYTAMARSRRSSQMKNLSARVGSQGGTTLCCRGSLASLQSVVWRLAGGDGTGVDANHMGRDVFIQI